MTHTNDFLGDCPSEASKLLVLAENLKVQFISTDTEPGVGDTVVYYGPERTVDQIVEDQEKSGNENADNESNAPR